VIPYLDLKAQYHSIKAEIDRAIESVLESSQFVLGKEVAAFEEEFASYSGGGQAIGLNSGTSALHLALLAGGIRPGDEVITTPFTFIATVASIHYAGAVPVFVDIDPASFTLNPALIEAAITPRTKAIMPVHLYGQVADMDPILEIGRRHNLLVIEDAAQAHGGEYKGRRAGCLADMACFSFYPGKNLGAYGEGGAVVTGNPEFAKTIRMQRDWGQSRRYYHDLPGFNYRMEGIQGAVLRVKLRHLEDWTEGRRSVAAFYTEQLKDCGFRLPQQMAYARHVWHVYAIRAAQRDMLAQNLNAAGVQTGIHYPIPVHLQKAYLDPRYGEGSFPVAEAAAREVLSLPLYPEMERRQMETVCEAVLEQGRLLTENAAQTVCSSRS
jgi:dTDP-4-amino-4,6-dideoxygalactose transaminase